ncbi:MAG TPA: glycosyltransferase family 4 protein [Ktedonobacteraceae bacterium]|jgi:glycosyltransferase involved in cell wall biosynthesis|nr:glycosyltransferase family 4 protein [Ktedonobacteraceae bacterium]
MMEKPRIYVAISTFFPYIGGAETQTLAQCQRLQEQGHQVRIVTFRHEATWKREEAIGGIATLRVAGPLLGRREHLPRSVQRLLYLLAMIVMGWTFWKQRHNFDVLQVCQCSLLVLPLGLVCLLAHKPMTIVFISAGADRASKTNAAAKLLAGPLDPEQPWLSVDGTTWIDGDLYGVQSAGALVVALTQTLLKRIGAVMIVLSTRMQHYLQANGFALPGYELIPNGVDVTRFQPLQPITINDDRQQHVVCVSRLRYEKGIDILLQAWRIVHEGAPGARLIVVGDGPIQRQLERLADELRIRNSVEFTGRRDDIPQQLHRGCIGVLPSRWEGMPNALLEAMASGLACVATRVSGSEDLITHQVNGLLVAPEDYAQMAQALLTLLHDPTLTKRYGLAARRTVEQGYALEYVTSRYISIYQKISKAGTSERSTMARSENRSLTSRS